ncbi:MAG: hypothetical protein ACOH2S_28180 [Janthinobacterium svalbardensis]|nr:hypothetical protein [Janthinobacterium svalbardensis]
MQTLMVVSRLFPDLLNGNKRSTIRFGEWHVKAAVAANGNDRGDAGTWA